MKYMGERERSFLNFTKAFNWNKKKSAFTIHYIKRKRRKEKPIDNSFVINNRTESVIAAQLWNTNIHCTHCFVNIKVKRKSWLGILELVQHHLLVSDASCFSYSDTQQALPDQLAFGVLLLAIRKAKYKTLLCEHRPQHFEQTIQKHKHGKKSTTILKALTNRFPFNTIRIFITCSRSHHSCKCIFYWRSPVFLVSGGLYSTLHTDLVQSSMLSFSFNIIERNLLFIILTTIFFKTFPLAENKLNFSCIPKVNRWLA